MNEKCSLPHFWSYKRHENNPKSISRRLVKDTVVDSKAIKKLQNVKQVDPIFVKRKKQNTKQNNNPMVSIYTGKKKEVNTKILL